MISSRPNCAQLPIFNSPFELGIRMVYLLKRLQPAGADLQRLVLLDYAVIYSYDLGGPSSLHTPVPYRGAEYLSRRGLIEQGLYLMSTRGLVEITMDGTGITYSAGSAARSMVGALTSPYLRSLEERCEWAVNMFSSFAAKELKEVFELYGYIYGGDGVTVEGTFQWV